MDYITLLAWQLFTISISGIAVFYFIRHMIQFVICIIVCYRLSKIIDRVEKAAKETDLTAAAAAVDEFLKH